jgi:hypothetical protein
VIDGVVRATPGVVEGGLEGFGVWLGTAVGAAVDVADGATGAVAAVGGGADVDGVATEDVVGAVAGDSGAGSPPQPARATAASAATTTSGYLMTTIVDAPARRRTGPTSRNLPGLPRILTAWGVPP